MQMHCRWCLVWPPQRFRVLLCCVVHACGAPRQLSGRKLILPRFHCHGAHGSNEPAHIGEGVERSADACLFSTHWSIVHLNRSPFGKDYRESAFLLHPYVPESIKARAKEVRSIVHRHTTTSYLVPHAPPPPPPPPLGL